MCQDDGAASAAGAATPTRSFGLPPWLLHSKKKKGITDHANPEGNGPQHSKERGWRGSIGPPQPEWQCQKHHQARKHIPCEEPGQLKRIMLLCFKNQRQRGQHGPPPAKVACAPQLLAAVTVDKAPRGQGRSFGALLRSPRQV